MSKRICALGKSAPKRTVVKVRRRHRSNYQELVKGAYGDISEEMRQIGCEHITQRLSPKGVIWGTMEVRRDSDGRI